MGAAFGAAFITIIAIITMPQKSALIGGLDHMSQHPPHFFGSASENLAFRCSAIFRYPVLILLRA